MSLKKILFTVDIDETDSKTSINTEPVTLCAMYLSEMISDSELQSLISSQIDNILSNDLSGLPNYVLISDESSINRIANFIHLFNMSLE